MKMFSLPFQSELPFFLLRPRTHEQQSWGPRSGEVRCSPLAARCQAARCQCPRLGTGEPSAPKPAEPARSPLTELLHGGHAGFPLYFSPNETSWREQEKIIALTWGGGRSSSPRLSLGVPTKLLKHIRRSPAPWTPPYPHRHPHIPTLPPGRAWGSLAHSIPLRQSSMAGQRG